MADSVCASIRVFSRPGCHLCEQLVEELLPLVRGRLEVEVVDVQSRPDWEQEYGLRIPVVEFDGQFVCQYHLDQGAIRRILEKLPASKAD